MPDPIKSRFTVCVSFLLECSPFALLVIRKASQESDCLCLSWFRFGTVHVEKGNDCLELFVLSQIRDADVVVQVLDVARVEPENAIPVQSTRLVLLKLHSTLVNDG